jgi:hypothetical protein
VTVSAAAFELVFFIAGSAFLATGLWTLWAVRDAYEQMGGGRFALDVPDRTPPEPLESPVGQVELQQLLDAIALVQRTRRDPDA